MKFWRPLEIATLMNMSLSLSRETSMTFSDMMKMPTHIFTGYYNSLVKQIEEENKKQQEEIDKAKSDSSYSMPSLPSFPNMPNFNNYNL